MLFVGKYQIKVHRQRLRVSNERVIYGRVLCIFGRHFFLIFGGGVTFAWFKCVPSSLTSGFEHIFGGINERSLNLDRCACWNSSCEYAGELLRNGKKHWNHLVVCNLKSEMVVFLIFVLGRPLWAFVSPSELGTWSTRYGTVFGSAFVRWKRKLTPGIPFLISVYRRKSPFFVRYRTRKRTFNEYDTIFHGARHPEWINNQIWYHNFRESGVILAFPWTVLKKCVSESDPVGSNEAWLHL